MLFSRDIAIEIGGLTNAPMAAQKKYHQKALFKGFLVII
jgi:hypothetical protein